MVVVREARSGCRASSFCFQLCLCKCIYINNLWGPPARKRLVINNLQLKKNRKKI
jgi:hypothetical protein